MKAKMNIGPMRGDVSPWGTIQDVTEAAVGVVFVMTAGRGGYWLSPARVAGMASSLKVNSSFYKGDGWFEEDCEWARVCLAYPGIFPTFAGKVAIATLDRTYPGMVENFVRERLGAREAVL